MGYSTDIDGELKFKKELTLSQLKKLNTILGELPRDLTDIVNPQGSNSYIQWELTKDYGGLKWDGNEKFYDIVESMNLIIATMKRDDPDFSVEGALNCQGEEMKDRWQLVIGEDGYARRKDFDFSKHIECPDCGHLFK